MRKNKLGFTLGLLSGFLWAAYLFFLDENYSQISQGLFISSLTIFFLNETFSLFWLTFIYHGKNISNLFPHKKIIKEKWFYFLLSPLGTISYILAIIVADSVTVSVFSATYPILTAFLAKLFLSTEIKATHYISATITFFGILLFSIGEISKIDINIYGVSLSLFCALCWAGESILCRYYSELNIETKSLLSIKYITSIIMGGVILLYISKTSNNSFNSITILNYNILFIISIISLISYLFYYKSIELIGSVYALNLNTTYVVWIMIFSLFKIEISIFSIIGSIFILFSILLISIQKDNS